MSTPSKKDVSVAVLGGGVTGVVTAVTLQEAGFSVHLYEQNRDLSHNRSSWLAGGMIAPWCERDASEKWVIDRGQTALEWWPRHYQKTRRCGSLVLSAWNDRHEIRRFSRRTQAYHYLKDESLLTVEPLLAGRFHEGLFFPDEMHLDPREALPDLVNQLRILGGKISFHHHAVTETVMEDVVIDCRGWAAHPQHPRLRGVRGEMLRVRSTELHFSRPIRLLHPRSPVYIVPRGNGIFMVGATSIESAYDGPVTVQSTYMLLEALQRLHPAFGEAEIVECNAGIRPAFPDNLPEIESKGRVISVNGMYRHGFLLSPWCAEHVLDHVMAYCGEMA